MQKRSATSILNFSILNPAFVQRGVTLPLACFREVFLEGTLSQDSSVNIVTRLRAGRSGVRSLARSRFVSLLQNAEIDCEVHPGKAAGA